MSNQRLVVLLRGYTALDESQVADSECPKDVASGLSRGEWKLIEVVKELQDCLTSDQDSVRARGVGLLAAVVDQLGDDALDRQTTRVLTTFFATKLADPSSLVHSANALARLAATPSFGTLEGVQVLEALFSSVSFTHVAQATRYRVYLLVDALMAHARPALHRLGAAGFLKPYCQLVEGEKDPRNLMISFGLVKVILLEFDLETVVEDLFDITFCYFPITFTPPPDDPYGITSQDLIAALRACLASTPQFGPLALPLFLDKLQASSEKAKRQTLTALCECFPIYGAQAVGEWAGRFSEALSIEVFHATDSSMQDLALETFYSLFKTLYPDTAPVRDREDRDEVMDDQTEKGDMVKGIAVQVVKNSLDELDEPDKSNAKPAMRILVTLAAASNRLGRYVLDRTVPQLVAVCQNPEEPTLRPAALSHLATLLSSLSPRSSSLIEPNSDAGLPRSVEVSSSSSLDFSPDAVTPTPLHAHLDTLLSLFTSSIRTSLDPSTRIPALTGLISLVKLDRFLSGPEVDYCVATFNDILLPSSSTTTTTQAENEEDDRVYDLALSNVIECSKRFPQTIQHSTLPLLLGALPSTVAADSLPTAGGGGRGVRAYQKNLSALAAICSVSTSPDLFESLLTTLVATLERTVSAALADVGPASVATLYAHDLLSTLKSVVQVKSKTRAGRDEMERLFVEGSFVTKLLDMFISPTLVQRGSGYGLGNVVAMDLRLLVDVGKILSLIFSTVSAERQTGFYRTFDDAFQHGTLDDLLKRRVDPAIPFAPFSASSPTYQHNLATLHTSILVALRPEVALAPADLSRTLDVLLLRRAVEATNELQLRASVSGLSNVINKRVDASSAVQGFLDGTLRQFWNDNVINNNNGEQQVEAGGTTTAAMTGANKRRRVIGLRVAGGIAKGLIVRSHERGYAMVNDLVELLGHDDEGLARDAADALGVVANAAEDDQDRVLSKENFSVIRLLWKQRFFTFLLPKLVDAYKQRTGSSPSPYTSSSSSASSSSAAVYLIALSSLLQHLPKQLTLTELPKLLPLLITALDLADPVLRSNVIDTLSIIVKEEPELLEPSITSIATKALKSAVVVDDAVVNSPSSLSPSSRPSPTRPRPQSPGSTKLRISSLKFLALLPSHVPYLTLHPHKSNVLRQLGIAIDDPKKDVRRWAVECRSAWYNYH